MPNPLFPELSTLVDGKTLEEHWQYYTVNVLLLGSLSHEQFCKEFPEAARGLVDLLRKVARLRAFVAEDSPASPRGGRMVEE